MFNLPNRRYTGSKTRLLEAIDESLLKHFDYTKYENLSFFDVFAGTGVVSEYFIKKKEFSGLIINDFLESNFVIYQGFFAKQTFNKDSCNKESFNQNSFVRESCNKEKLESYVKSFNELDSNALESNYYSQHFGSAFFSFNDSKKIGFIRDRLDILLESKMINTQEFYILLASLLYSVDRIANTVGHYDAYRKNVVLKDRFIYELIKPLDMQDKKIKIYKKDSNILAKELMNCFYFKQDIKTIESKTLINVSCPIDIAFPIDIVFLDPPYNSRQYARFYHLLETLSLNNKPKLYGIAKKPKPSNMSEYCKVHAKEALKDLLDSLSQYTRYIVMTYNNTYTSKSNSSQNKINLNELQNLLESYGTTHIHEYDFKAFNSGKTDINTSFKGHKEYIFVCEVENNIKSTKIIFSTKNY